MTEVGVGISCKGLSLTLNPNPDGAPGKGALGLRHAASTSEYIFRSSRVCEVRMQIRK